MRPLRSYESYVVHVFRGEPPHESPFYGFIESEGAPLHFDSEETLVRLLAGAGAELELDIGVHARMSVM